MTTETSVYITLNKYTLVKLSGPARIDVICLASDFVYFTIAGEEYRQTMEDAVSAIACMTSFCKFAYEDESWPISKLIIEAQKKRDSYFDKY